MNAVELERNGCFFVCCFTLIEEILCCDCKEHRQNTKIPNMIHTGVQICEGGSKSAVTPASSRRQKISMILQIAPLIDQISVLDGVVVPIVGVEGQKKFPATVKVGLGRFQKPMGELARVYHRYYSRCLENSHNLASVGRLLTTVSKITHDIRLKSRLGIGQ